MNSLGLPGGGVPNLGQRPPKFVHLIETHGLYRFTCVGGIELTVRIEGKVDTALAQSADAVVTAPVVLNATKVVLNTEGQWVDHLSDGKPIRLGIAFPNVLFWEIIYDPSDKPEKPEEKTESGIVLANG